MSIDHRAYIMVYAADMSPDGFALDPRIEGSSFLIQRLGLSQLRLQNDRRWPWLVLVPEIADMQEIVDLSEAQQGLLLGDIRAACEMVRKLASLMDYKVGKLNVANLGNIVAQLHLHVIARNADDPAWPGPVWGFGTAVPFADGEHERIIGLLK